MGHGVEEHRRRTVVDRGGGAPVSPGPAGPSDTVVSQRIPRPRPSAMGRLVRAAHCPPLDRCPAAVRTVVAVKTRTAATTRAMSTTLAPTATTPPRAGWPRPGRGFPAILVHQVHQPVAGHQTQGQAGGDARGGIPGSAPDQETPQPERNEGQGGTGPPAIRGRRRQPGRPGHPRRPRCRGPPASRPRPGPPPTDRPGPDPGAGRRSGPAGAGPPPAWPCSWQRRWGPASCRGRPASASCWAAVDESQ